MKFVLRFVVLAEIPQVVQDIAQKASARKPSTNGVRPVDQSQASKGKLDYVKVQL